MKHNIRGLALGMMATSAVAVHDLGQAEACTIGYAPPAAAYPTEGHADVPTNTRLWVRGLEDEPTTVKLLDAATGAVLQDFSGTEPASDGEFLRAYEPSDLAPQTAYKWRVGEEVVAFTTGAGPTDAAPPAPPLLAFRIDSFDPYNPQHHGPGLCGPNDYARVFFAAFAWEAPPEIVGYRLYRSLDGVAELLSQAPTTWLHFGTPEDAALAGYYPYLEYTMYDNLNVLYDYELRAVSPTGAETAFVGTVPRETPAARLPEDSGGCRAAPATTGPHGVLLLAAAGLTLGLRRRGGRYADRPC